MIRRYLSRPQFIIVAAIVVAAQFIPLPYVVLQPGPTYNLLGKALVLPVGLDKSAPAPSQSQSPTRSQLLATTVYVTNPAARIYAPQLLVAWLNGQMAVYPRDIIYPKSESAKQTLAAGKAEMTNSEADAISAAANFIDGLSPDSTGASQSIAKELRNAPIKFSLQETGGPSAGLGFALSLVDRTIAPTLIGSRIVAATGTIDRQGVVGAIGGIDQKLSGAARAGATLFLLPRDNCADITRVPHGLRLAPVSSLGEAVHVLSGALATHC